MVRLVRDFGVIVSAFYGVNSQDEEAKSISEKRYSRDFDWSVGLGYEFRINKSFIMKPSLHFNSINSDVTSYQYDFWEAYRGWNFLSWKIDSIFRSSDKL
jgi:hypothetical protein